jgi:MFS family permease
LFRADLGHTFNSLRDNRALQIYLLSQMARLWAWAALQVAVSWLVYSATKSSLILAYVNFGNFIPMLLFGMTGGYIADRFNRKKILFVTQTLNIVLMVTFAILAAQSERAIWPIAIAYLLVGIVFAHDQPVRQALIMNLVPPHQRVNAFCCEMIISTLTMMAGFASAGILVAQFGESVCFLVGALALVLATFFLFFVRPQVLTETTEDKPEPSAIKIADSIAYVSRNRDVRQIFLHNSLALLFGTKYGLLFPSITMILLHGSSKVLGYLDAANSIGGAIAGVVLANLTLTPKWGGPYAAVVGALLLFALAESGNFTSSALVVVLLGLCFTLQNNGNYAVLQTIVPDRLRGRVIALYLVITQLIDQVGNIFAGWGAGKLGVRNILIIEGSICAAVFLYVSFNRFKEITASRA